MSCQSCIAAVEDKINELQKLRKEAKKLANEHQKNYFISQGVESKYISEQPEPNTIEAITPDR